MIGIIERIINSSSVLKVCTYYISLLSLSIFLISVYVVRFSGISMIADDEKFIGSVVTRISDDILSHVERNNSLPYMDDFEQIISNYADALVKDGHSRKVVYKLVNKDSFDLCASFVTSYEFRRPYKLVLSDQLQKYRLNYILTDVELVSTDLDNKTGLYADCYRFKIDITKVKSEGGLEISEGMSEISKGMSEFSEGMLEFSEEILEFSDR